MPLLLLGKKGGKVAAECKLLHPRSEGDKCLSGKVSVSDTVCECAGRREGEGESRASPREIKLRRGIQRKTLISAFDKKGIESLFLSQPPTEGTAGECSTPSLTTQVRISFPLRTNTPIAIIFCHLQSNILFFFLNSVLIPMPGKKKTNQKNFSNIEPGNRAHLLQMTVALTLVHLVCFVYSFIFF